MNHVHELAGCAPVPLAHYLKALGILRLVAEQADPQARGCWQGDQFRLATALDRGQLQRFFLDDYQPSPLLAPWNKGSGFYNDDPAPKPLRASTARRFQHLRDGLHDADALLGEQRKADARVRAIKAESRSQPLTAAARAALRESAAYKKRLASAEREFKALKEDLILNCRRSWRGAHREWMDAAMILDEHGIPHFPALLGTGGNDGRLDFTNNFMQRLGDVFDLADPAGKASAHAPAWLDAALWQATAAHCQSGASVGQYLPGTAGGANNSNGSMADSQLNPFDFLLMMEGVLLFSAHATRRFSGRPGVGLAAPFAVSAHGAGYASAAESDEGARGEQWMPLWAQPLALGELRRLLGEGRAQVGARVARDAVGMARSVAELGIAPGIDALQRFGFVERNGQSSLAVPLGRFRVPGQASPLLRCLDDLDAWLPRLRRVARAAPIGGFKRAERRLCEGLMAVTQRPHEGLLWQRLLCALAEIDNLRSADSEHAVGAIPALRVDWVRAAAQGDATSAELRLALALAGRRGHSRADAASGATASDAPGRRGWLWKGRHHEADPQGRWPSEAEPAWNVGGDAAEAVAWLCQVRLEAEPEQELLAATAARPASACAQDLAALLEGKVDLPRSLTLARALRALDPAPAPPLLPPVRAGDAWPDDAWLVIRLALSPLPGHPRSNGADPAIRRRLIAGDAAGALGLAVQRLRACGIHTGVQVASLGAVPARRWAAALAFPITQSTAQDFLRRMDSTTIDINREFQT